MIISHHGIRGMKWGSRKMTTPSSVSDDAKKASDSKDKVKSGGTKTLTTKELQDLVLRMNLEQQLSKLQPPSNKQQVAKFFSDVFINIGKQQVNKIVTDLITKGISSALKK